jgi:hypothetical protein
VALDSYWFDKPWFHTEGNLLLYASHLTLGVPNGRVLHASSLLWGKPRIYFSGSDVLIVCGAIDL